MDDGAANASMESPSALARWRNRKGHLGTDHDDDTPASGDAESDSPMVEEPQRPEPGAAAASASGGEKPAGEEADVPAGGTAAPGGETGDVESQQPTVASTLLPEAGAAAEIASAGDKPTGEAAVPAEGTAESQPPTVAATDGPEARATDVSASGGEKPSGEQPPAVPAGGATASGAGAQAGMPPTGSKLDRWKSRAANQANATNAAAPPAADPPANAAQAPVSGKLDRWKKRIATQSGGQAAGAGASPAGGPQASGDDAGGGNGGTPGVQQDPLAMLPTSQGGKRGHPVPITDAWLRRALEKRWNQPLFPGAAPAAPGTQNSAPGAPAQPASKLDRWKKRIATAAAPGGGSASTPAPESGAPPAAGAAGGAAAAKPANKLDRWKARIATQKAGGEQAGGGQASAGEAPPAQPPAAAAAKPAGSKLDRWKTRIATQAAGAPAGGQAGGQAAGGQDGGAAAAVVGGAGAGGKGNKLDRWKKRIGQQKAGAAGAGAVPPGAGAGGAPAENASPAAGAGAAVPDGGVIQMGAMALPKVCPGDLGTLQEPVWTRCGLPDLAGVYVGYVVQGKPHGNGSFLFAKDNSHYHGSWNMGRLEGRGKMIWQDGSMFVGGFRDAKPFSPATEQRPAVMFNQYMEMYKVRFDGSKSFIDGALPVVKVELPFPPYLPAQRDCVALSNGSPWDDGKPAGKYPHIKDVTGKMVMACPPFGDVPLWNAEQVRGKMVAIMRGPSSQKPSVPFHIKMFHAQNAGAIGVVFINDIPQDKSFTAIPRVDSGAIQAPWGDGTQMFKPTIPACIVLHDFTTIIQEGATFVMCFAPRNFPGTPPDPWQVGFMLVPPQEGRGASMSKASANELMLQFLNARRTERTEEETQDRKEKISRQKKSSAELDGKEFFGGSILDSLNPLKQLMPGDLKDKKMQGHLDVDDKMKQSIVTGLEKLAGVDNASWFRKKAQENDEWLRLKAREQQAALLPYLPASLASVEISTTSHLAEKPLETGKKLKQWQLGESKEDEPSLPAQKQEPQAADAPQALPQKAAGDKPPPEKGPPGAGMAGELPKLPGFTQDVANGYHNIRFGATHFCGMLEQGLPTGNCSLHWADTSELHTNFVNGEIKPNWMSRYIFSKGEEEDGSTRRQFTGVFRGGYPDRGFLTDLDGSRWRVTFDGNTALWDNPEPLTKEEDKPSPFNSCKGEIVALTKCKPMLQSADGSATLVPNYNHVTNVFGRVIWARPMFADAPLWNAEEVRGKLVAVMRGPRAPAVPVNYSQKLYHCQQAGAVGVIFVDWDPNGKFAVLPRLEEGLMGDSGISLQVRIPSCFVLAKHQAVVQEGAIVHMQWAPLDHPWQKAAQGWRIGFLVCQRQEYCVGLSKDKADDLMKEFLLARKEERKEEDQMMKDKKSHVRTDADAPEGLENKEYVGGNIFNSLNPLHQDAEVKVPSASQGISRAMLNRFTTKERAEYIATHAETGTQMLGGFVQGAFATMGPSFLDLSVSPKVDKTNGERRSAGGAVIRPPTAAASPEKAAPQAEGQATPGGGQGQPKDFSEGEAPPASWSLRKSLGFT